MVENVRYASEIMNDRRSPSFEINSTHEFGFSNILNFSNETIDYVACFALFYYNNQPRHEPRSGQLSTCLYFVEWPTNRNIRHIWHFSHNEVEEKKITHTKNQHDNWFANSKETSRVIKWLVVAFSAVYHVPMWATTFGRCRFSGHCFPIRQRTRKRRKIPSQRTRVKWVFSP